MPPKDSPAEQSFGLYDLELNDPDGVLVERSGLDHEALTEISRVMSALAALRQAEERLSEASLAYMRLGRNDMRALHFLMVAEASRTIVTPGALAEQLKLSTASITKMLDRLERGGHITRSIHPNDRRAQAIAITPSTRAAAMRTVGRKHAQRFHAAARLNSDERKVVERFLTEMASDLDISDEQWLPSEAQAESAAQDG